MVRQGYIILVDFDPQAGHEQKGRRPALVVSNSSLNAYTNMVIVCPITNASNNQPFRIKLDNRTKTTGTVMCDQARALDIRARSYKFLEVAPKDILSVAADTVGGFMDIDK